jgi:hypothetical protein
MYDRFLKFLSDFGVSSGNLDAIKIFLSHTSLNRYSGIYCMYCEHNIKISSAKLQKKLEHVIISDEFHELTIIYSFGKKSHRIMNHSMKYREFDVIIGSCYESFYYRITQLER